MSPIFRNILSVVAGFIVGSIVNMGLITLSPWVIPPPVGVDITTAEGLKEALPLFQPKHFLFPFLAHALGTLFGAFVAAKLAASHKFYFALTIGILFLMGGIANILMLPSPLWYTVVDLGLAYLPMAFLGWKLAKQP
jgi:hypothetical protein